MKLPWLDIALIAALFLATRYVNYNVSPTVQPASLSDPALQKPHLPDIVPFPPLLYSCLLVPPLIYSLLFLPRVPAPALLQFTLALFATVATTRVTVAVTKAAVGRPRPFFAAACEAYAPGAQQWQCTGDEGLVNFARTSFPSGHSAISFATATLLALVLSNRVADVRAPIALLGPLSRAVLVAAPFAVALFVACSRLVDFHHFYSDVIAGALIGIAVALVVAWGFRADFVVRGADGAEGETGGEMEARPLAGGIADSPAYGAV